MLLHVNYPYVVLITVYRVLAGNSESTGFHKASNQRGRGVHRGHHLSGPRFNKPVPQYLQQNYPLRSSHEFNGNENQSGRYPDYNWNSMNANYLNPNTSQLRPSFLPATTPYPQCPSGSGSSSHVGSNWSNHQFANPPPVPWQTHPGNSQPSSHWQANRANAPPQPSPQWQGQSESR